MSTEEELDIPSAVKSLEDRSELLLKDASDNDLYMSFFKDTTLLAARLFGNDSRVVQDTAELEVSAFYISNGITGRGLSEKDRQSILMQGMIYFKAVLMALGPKVFLVHGQNHGMKEMVARFLEKIHMQPLILHEQPDGGKTIIEKFEAHSADVSCAVVILTADDQAEPRNEPGKKELRARQNVILELGYFVGRLGRKRTFALVERGVTLPSDINGVIFISLENADWRWSLARELKSAGLPVDANKLF